MAEKLDFGPNITDAQSYSSYGYDVDRLEYKENYARCEYMIELPWYKEVLAFNAEKQTSSNAVIDGITFSVTPSFKDYVVKRKKSAYIYFLVDSEGGLLYIGKSTSLCGRIRSHIKAGTIPFVRVVAIRLDDYLEKSNTELSRCEDYFIKKLNPPYNLQGTEQFKRGKLNPRFRSNTWAGWRIDVVIQDKKAEVDEQKEVFAGIVKMLGIGVVEAKAEIFKEGMYRIVHDPKYKEQRDEDLFLAQSMRELRAELDRIDRLSSLYHRMVDAYPDGEERFTQFCIDTKVSDEDQKLARRQTKSSLKRNGDFR